jgi:hypothetical protein
MLRRVLLVLAAVGAGLGGGTARWMRPQARGPVPAAELAASLEASVRGLGGPRESASEREVARAWIRARWESQGWSVEERRRGDTVNLAVQTPGAGTLLVVAAHYDTDARRRTPGGDDNASGVAVLLELSRALRGGSPGRPVRFVALDREEAPWFGSADHGAVVEAEGLEGRVDAMISIESVGYYDEREGTQTYPIPVAWLFGTRADFVTLVANPASAALAIRAARAFRAGTSLPAAVAVMPRMVPGVDWSDHAAFWDRGVAALLVTDMPPFRNPHYHQPSDTPETLDYPRLAGVVAGLEALIRELAG